MCEGMKIGIHCLSDITLCSNVHNSTSLHTFKIKELKQKSTKSMLTFKQSINGRLQILTLFLNA